MTTQYGLFDPPPVPTVPERRLSRKRSRAAKSDAYYAAERGEQARAVLDVVRQAGADGVTRHEIAERLGIPVSSVCGRVDELLRETPSQIFVGAERRARRSVLFARGHG